MSMMTRWRRGLWLLAALLLAAGACEAAAGEQGEIGLMAPGLSLAGDDDPDDTPLPTLSPEPTAEPTPVPTATPIPYYTSPRYPADKVIFEGEIWSILTERWGLTDYQAAGLMGCIQAESNFSPYNAERIGGVDDRGAYAFDTDDAVGFGLCQWTSSGRKARLLALAESRGGAALVWDFDTQMEYMRGEIDLEALKSADSLYAATEWAVLVYERPNLRYANSWPGTRYERGREIYERHTGRACDEPALAFEITLGDVATRLLPGGSAAEATITVRSNYYWRLSLSGGEGRLSVQGEQIYHPGAMERCVCGYACEGDKPLTLRFSPLPAEGETLTASLRFELYRGGHVVKTVPVALTGGRDGEAPALKVSRGRATRGKK